MDRVIGVGVAVPSIVDSRNGYIHIAEFFLWQNLPLQESGGRVQCSCVRSNDANAATLAES